MLVPTMAQTERAADPFTAVQSNDWYTLCSKCHQVHVGKKTFNCINRSEGNDHIVCAWPKFHCTELRAKSWPSEVSGANPFLPCLGFCPHWFISFMEGRCIVRHIIWNCWKEKLRPENGLLEPMRVQKKKPLLNGVFPLQMVSCLKSVSGGAKVCQQSIFLKWRGGQHVLKYDTWNKASFSRCAEDEVGHCALWLTDLRTL